MKPCKRVGVNLSWRCQWKCQTCFYRRNDNFNKAIDRPIEQINYELSAARQRGCDHAVAVGEGEPTLYPFIKGYVESCKQFGLTSSIITNGATDLQNFIDLYEAGLNHFHVSVHGVGTTLDKVACVVGASEKQDIVKTWMRNNNIPWRSNTTLQRANYQELPEIVENILSYGAYHIVLLGFLPHYEWQNRLTEVAVHPAELRPYIEKCCEILEASGKLFTIRYHPFCHLDEKYWKYVVNAKYVLYDPFEWEYGNMGKNEPAMWMAACQMAESVGVQGEPCYNCNAHLHCGGWNRHYAAGFNGADLKAITLDIPQIRGYYHDQNPTNDNKGFV
jgi:MoaA/NifB/PqqE/SkfB family radical SAM enzyme